MCTMSLFSLPNGIKGKHFFSVRLDYHKHEMWKHTHSFSSHSWLRALLLRWASLIILVDCFPSKAHFLCSPCWIILSRCCSDGSWNSSSRHRGKTLGRLLSGLHYSGKLQFLIWSPQHTNESLFSVTFWLSGRQCACARRSSNVWNLVTTSFTFDQSLSVHNAFD